MIVTNASFAGVWLPKHNIVFSDMPVESTRVKSSFSIKVYIFNYGAEILFPVHRKYLYVACHAAAGAKPVISSFQLFKNNCCNSKKQ